MPLYLVTTGEGDDKKERLVEAANPAGARNFVVRDSVKAVIVEPRDLHRLAVAGVEIEVATGGEPEAPETSPAKKNEDEDK